MMKTKHKFISISMIYVRFVMFRLTSTGFNVKKVSESTKLSWFRSENVKDRQMEDTTILREKKEGKG